MNERKCDLSCRFWTYDMDGVFCQHPKSFEIAPVFGASTNRMSVEGHCRVGDNLKPGERLVLWEPATKKANGE
jgi:hypothetical protein